MLKLPQLKGIVARTGCCSTDYCVGLICWNAEKKKKVLQQEAEYEKTKLLREELKECALREHVNAPERCASLRRMYMQQAEYARGRRQQPPDDLRTE